MTTSHERGIEAACKVTQQACREAFERWAIQCPQHQPPFHNIDTINGFGVEGNSLFSAWKAAWNHQQGEIKRYAAALKAIRSLDDWDCITLAKRVALRALSEKGSKNDAEYKQILKEQLEIAGKLQPDASAEIKR